MQSPNRDPRKLAVIFGGVVILIFIVMTIILIKRPRPNPSPTQETVYHDPYSGETVTDIKGKTPDTYGTNPDKPIYLGISKLLDYGVTATQLEDFKQAVYNYSLNRNPRITEISIHVATLKRKVPDPNSDSVIDTLFFDVTINRKDTYQAQFDYSLLNTGHLYLSQNNKIIFDSGDINVEQAQNSDVGD